MLRSSTGEVRPRQGTKTPRIRVLSRLIALGLGMGLALWTATVYAGDEPPQVTNGGYMQTSPDASGKATPLPLTHTGVEAEISGVVSAVKVTQQFHNPYSKPIEAVYVFPLPHRAAIHELVIRVGDRTITGVIKRRAQARAIYKRARAAGKTAALLTQERPNIFTQSIANIMPGDKIQVTLRYVENLTPRHGRYEFVFPMVVGPRYVGGGERLGTRSGNGWAQDTTRIRDASRITPRLLRKGQRPGHDITVQLRINAGGLKVRHLQAVTHQTVVANSGQRASVVLSPRDAIPNKDFVVRYQLAGARPEVAVLPQRDRRGGHFLLMIQPRARMKQRDISPREYVFVVDNSGSMFGFPLKQARAVVRRCLGNTKKGDTFQIIKFAGSPDQFASKAVPVTADNIKAGIRYVSSMQGGGGTEFIPALKLALGAPKDPARSRIVLFITDGYVGYERQVLRFLRKHGSGSNVFALGVGSSVNRFLIDGMARFGGAAPFYLLNTEKASSVVERIYSTISRPALTNIQITWHGLDVKEQTPRRVPDLFGDLPVVLAGRYDKGGSGQVTVRGMLAGKPFDRTLAVTLPARPRAGNAAVAHLWARLRVASWMDIYATEPGRAAEVKKKVTALALRYNLISRFTSFVAVDRRVRNKGGEQATVPLPLPLPQGVSARAAPPAAYASQARGLHALSGPAGSGAIFGGATSLGADSEDALGALIGGAGVSSGVGGLGLVGAGRGGGGAGRGSLGIGTLGTIGRCGGDGVGYGRGGGHLRGRRASGTRVVAGKAMVRGALSRAIIRRVIRRHINEVRYCYAREQQHSPRLAGGVVVQFTIASTGMVLLSKIKSSTLGNPAVEACIAAAVKRWLFPRPRGGGIVVVSYPFAFKAAASPTSASPASASPPSASLLPPTRPASFRANTAADGTSANGTLVDGTLAAAPANLQQRAGVSPAGLAGTPPTASGCACQAGASGGEAPWLLGVLLLGLVWRRRRKMTPKCRYHRHLSIKATRQLAVSGS